MINFIASLQNSKIKLAASLKQKKHRDLNGLFIAEGLRLCEEAARSDYCLEYCLCCDDGHNQESERFTGLKNMLLAKDCPVYFVSRQIYDKVSDTQEPQGILLVIRQQVYGLSDLLCSNAAALIVALDGVQDPGNLGTIIRTADAAGCSGVVLLKNTVDLFSPKTVRGTMGSIFHLPIALNVDAKEFSDFFMERKIQIFLTQLDKQSKSYFEADFISPTALVFGNEGNGISDIMRISGGESLFIPMPGHAESLNVSTAASIMIYEALRQRTTAESK